MNKVTVLNLEDEAKQRLDAGELRELGRALLTECANRARIARGDVPIQPDDKGTSLDVALDRITDLAVYGLDELDAWLEHYPDLKFPL